MGHLSIDTIPLTTVAGTTGQSFTVHLDEQAGTVTLSPSDS